LLLGALMARSVRAEDAEDEVVDVLGAAEAAGGSCGILALDDLRGDIEPAATVRVNH
jgi:hypothetical protein